MLKPSESDKLCKELLIKTTGDDGFNDARVYSAIQEVMGSGMFTEGQQRVFVEELSGVGCAFAERFCELYCRKGLWGVMSLFTPVTTH